MFAVLGDHDNETNLLQALAEELQTLHGTYDFIIKLKTINNFIH